MTDTILITQAAHMTCQERAMDLEKELSRLKDFEAEKARYILSDQGSNALTYTLRQEHQGEEPLHHLCCRCYAEATKSILQFARLERSDRVLACPRCKAEVRFPHGIPQTVLTAPARSRFTEF